MVLKHGIRISTHILSKRKMSQEELKMSKTELSGFLQSALKTKKQDTVSGVISNYFDSLASLVLQQSIQMYVCWQNKSIWNVFLKENLRYQVNLKLHCSE